MTYPDPATPTPRIPAGSRPPNGGERSAGAAKQQAREVKDTAAQAATDVAHTAKDQAATVASEAKNQAKDLLRQTQHELTSQAGNQQRRAASGLRELGEELRSMAERSENTGPATTLSRQAAERATSIADWLENREPGEVLNEVKRFARNRPAAFLALAAGAGLLTSRLVRGLAADSPATEGAGSDRPTHSGTSQDVPSARPAPVPGEPALAAPQAPHIDAGAIPPSSGVPSSGLPTPGGGVPSAGLPAPSGDVPGASRASEGRHNA